MFSLLGSLHVPGGGFFSVVSEGQRLIILRHADETSYAEWKSAREAQRLADAESPAPVGVAPLAEIQQLLRERDYAESDLTPERLPGVVLALHQAVTAYRSGNMGVAPDLRGKLSMALTDLEEALCYELDYGCAGRISGAITLLREALATAAPVAPPANRKTIPWSGSGSDLATDVVSVLDQRGLDSFCEEFQRKSFEKFGMAYVLRPSAMSSPAPAEPVAPPVPLFLTCPMCGTRHVDRGEFATKPHHTHSCQNPKCCLTWRPAVQDTVGVQHLPGFLDATEESDSVESVAPPLPEPTHIDEAAASLLFALHIYPGHRIDHRGPLGCICGALAKLRPDIDAFLRENPGEFSAAYEKFVDEDGCPRPTGAPVAPPVDLAEVERLAFKIANCALCKSGHPPVMPHELRTSDTPSSDTRERP